MMKYHLFAVLHIVLCVGSLKSDPIPHSINPLILNGRIVGGKATTIEEFPFQVSVQMNHSHYCGGSIISDEYIVTAAHCSLYPMSWISIHMGSTGLTGGERHELREIIKHENYTKNLYRVPINDIALLRLETPITFDSTKQPIQIFNQGEIAIEGTMTTLIGWGDRYEAQNKPSDVLRKVEVPIYPKKQCSDDYRRVFLGAVPENQICAGYPDGGKGGCSGDSGGPLVIDGRLAGLTSWSLGCGDRHRAGVFTEVASFHDWIYKNANL